MNRILIFVLAIFFTCFIFSSPHNASSLGYSESIDETVSITDTVTAQTLGAPQGLTVNQTSFSNNDLVVQWSPPSNDGGSSITQYVVQRSSGFTLSFSTVGTVNGPFFPNANIGFTDSGLDSDTQYVYRVYAVNSIGNGPVSDIAYGTTSETPTLGFFGSFGNPLLKGCGTSPYGDCYQDGDIITLTFSDPTNAPDVSNKAAVDNIISFKDPFGNPINLGSAYHGTWVTPQILVITVDDVTGTNLPNSGFGAIAYVNSNPSFTNSQGTVQVASFTPSLIFGDFTHTAAPILYSFVADNPHGLTGGYQSGDTLTMRFSEPTNQPEVSTKADIDKIFFFYNGFFSNTSIGGLQSLGADYTGKWINPQTLQINITDATGAGQIIVGELNASANSNQYGASVPILNAQGTSSPDFPMISPLLSGSFVGNLQSNQYVGAGNFMQVSLPSGLSAYVKSSNAGTITVVNSSLTAIQSPGSQTTLFGDKVDIAPSGNTCSPSCTVSFLYSAADLTNLGFSVNDVKIFHDINNVGTVGTSEEVPGAVITQQGDLYNITATVPHFSKFAIGGVVTVLAILGAGGGGEAPTPPTLSGSDYNSSEYPLSIGANQFMLPNQTDIVPTSTISTGTPTHIKILAYDSAGPDDIQGVALYTNLYGDDPQVTDADTAISFEDGQPFTLSDPHGFFKSVNCTASDDGDKKDIDFELSFAKPMPTSDMIIRISDKNGYTSDVRVINATEVVKSPSSTATDLFSQTHLIYKFNSTQTGQATTIPVWIKNNARWWADGRIDSNNFLVGIQYMVQNDMIEIPNNNMISSSQTGNIQVQSIPAWVKSDARWWADGSISDAEFEDTIGYLINNGIMHPNGNTSHRVEPIPFRWNTS